MKVVLDTTSLYVTKAGTSRYINGFLSGLKASPNLNLVLSRICWPVENFGYVQPTRMLKTAYRELIWANFFAPQLLRQECADILHSPVGFFLTPPSSTRLVITIHDLALFQHPERFRAWQRWSGKRRLNKSIAADRIICVSHFTADNAIRKLGLSHSQIDVIHNASDLKQVNQIEKLPTELPFRDDFFLFVGSLEPGKNLRLLLETYRLAAERGRTLPDLIIIGTRWHGVPHEGHPPPNWIFLGRQPDNILIWYYCRAIALLFPSKYEGFGIPVLEAMGLGCPVICSPVASLPEVGGETVLYSQLTADGYLEQILRLMNDRGLREDLQCKGLERAKKFSWEKCALETFESYQKALA